MAQHRVHKVNLNTATRDELMRVAGIGPEIAARIVEFREDNGPFESFAALDDIYDMDEEAKLRLREQTTLGNGEARRGEGRGRNGESSPGEGRRPDRRR
ncbi:MAG: helix-hairpin-helix domain-containing protein, partial [Candidatus Latescibacterota bacterium]